MKKSLSLALSAALTLTLFSGCNDATTQESTTTSVQNLHNETTLQLRTKKLKIYLASSQESKAQRSVSVNTTPADILYLLSTTDETINYDTITTHTLYNTFKSAIVDSDKLNADELSAFEQMSIEDFNKDFIKDYFGLYGKYQTSKVHTLQHLQDMGMIDSSDKEAIAASLFDITLDYSTMSASFVDDLFNVDRTPLQEYFFTARKANSEIETKLIALLHSDPLVAKDILSYYFNSEHLQYNREHLSSSMYEALCSAIFTTRANINDTTALTQALYSSESFVLPNQSGIKENQDSFAKHFFNIGDEVHGDGDEIATEKLLFMWTYNNVVSPLNLFQTTTQDSLQDNSLDYLDFIYLGLQPDGETQEKQASHFGYVRESALNFRASVAKSDISGSELLVKTDTQDISALTFPIIDVISKAQYLQEVYEAIPYSRYLPYAYQSVKNSFSYYDEANSSELQTYIAQSYSYFVNNLENPSLSKQRSGGIDLGYMYELLVSRIGQFSELDFSEQITLLIEYIFYDKDISQYFDDPKDPWQDANLINSDDFNLSNYSSFSDDSILRDIAKEGYSDIKLYHSDITWQYLPSKLTHTDFVRLDDTVKNSDFTFDFVDGRLKIYLISTLTTEQLREYIPSIQLATQATILSEDEQTLYKLYAIEVYGYDEDKTYNFSQLFEHIDAMFIDSNDIYLDKTSL